MPGFLKWVPRGWATKVCERRSRTCCAKNLPSAIVFRRRDYETDAMLRELCTRRGLRLPAPHRPQLGQEPSGTVLRRVGTARARIAVLVICSDSGSGDEMRAALAPATLHALSTAAITEATALDDADKVLVLLSAGVLAGGSASLQTLQRCLADDKKNTQDRVVLVFMPENNLFESEEKRSAPKHVKDALGSHEAIPFRPPNENGRSHHEYRAMVGELLLRFGAHVVAPAPPVDVDRMVAERGQALRSELSAQGMSLEDVMPALCLVRDSVVHNMAWRGEGEG